MVQVSQLKTVVNIQDRGTVKHDTLIAFARESNEIEGITDERRHLSHAAALEKFLKLKEVTVHDVQEFVAAVEPGAFLRTCDHHRVFIGGKEAPKGSGVLVAIHNLIGKLEFGPEANKIHKEYENLHPFTDGNGRSGRAIWLWQMVNHSGYDGRYKFLQQYYYKTLA